MNLEVLLGQEFRVGLVLGVVAAAVVAGVGMVWRARRGRPVHLAGVALAVATLAGLSVAGSIPSGLLVAVLVLAIGGVLVPVVPRRSWVAPLLAVPGALLLSVVTDVELPGWTTWVIFIVVVVATPLASDFERRFTQWTPVLFVLFAVGVFLSVPDTEGALVLLGVAAPLAIVPAAGATFGAVGIYPALGVAMWVIADGASGRPAAVFGAAACLGVLVMEPIARRISPRRATLLDRVRAPFWEGVAVVVIQVAAVLAASRVAGLQADPLLAAIEAALVLSALAGLLLTGVYVPRWRSSG